MRPARLEWEFELLDFTAIGHPLELPDHIAWNTYCPVNRLVEHVGEQVVTCGLIIEQRVHHQVTGEAMKFLTLADWTGIVETELFAPTYRSYGLATVRYPVLEVTATVEPFENGRGFSCACCTPESHGRLGLWTVVTLQTLGGHSDCVDLECSFAFTHAVASYLTKYDILHRQAVFVAPVSSERLRRNR